MDNVLATKEKPMLQNMKFLWEPVRCCVIKLPERIFTQCEDFAHEVYDSNKDCYAIRGQSDKATIIRQIITGKLGEWGVYFYINSFLGSHSNEPDMKIYGAKGKSFEADLMAGDPEEPMIRFPIHVKSILCTQVKRYGLSWLMQKNDPLFKNTHGELLAYCQVIDKQIIHFYGFQDSRKLTLGEPKKKALESKYALYFNEQESEHIKFFLH